MKSKTSKDCNGLESEIYYKITTGDISWFPTKRSRIFGLLFL